MANPAGLGEPIRTFDGRPARRRALTWLIALAVAVVVLVPAAVAAFLAGRAWLGAPLTAIAMGSAAAAGWIAGRDTMWKRARVVRLFTGGLLITPAPRPGAEARPSRGEGQETGAFTWDDLASVTVSGVRSWGGAPAPSGRGTGSTWAAGAHAPDTATRWRFTVVAWDGRVLRFGDELPGVRVLGETVAAEVTRRAVPRYVAAVKGGEPVRLGPFTVDLDGVEKDGQRLAWQAVRKVEIGGGLVTVRARGGHPDLVAIAGQVPDALSFTLLCDQVKHMLG